MLFLLNFLFPGALAIHPGTWVTRNTRSPKDTHPIWNNRFTVSIKVQSSTPATQQLLFFAVLSMGTETRAIVPLGFLMTWLKVPHNGVKQEISPVQGPAPGKANKTQKQPKCLKSLNKRVHKSQQKLNTGAYPFRGRRCWCDLGEYVPPFVQEEPGNWNPADKTGMFKFDLTGERGKKIMFFSLRAGRQGEEASDSFCPIYILHYFLSPLLFYHLLFMRKAAKLHFRITMPHLILSKMFLRGP